MQNLHKIDNFPAFANSQKNVRREVKNLPQSHEIRALVIRLLVGVKSSALTFNAKCKPNDGSGIGGADDRQLLAKAAITRVRLKRDGEVAAYDVKTEDLAIGFGGQHQRSMFGSGIRDGDAIPANAGAEKLFELDLVIDFTHSAWETPNKLCPGTEQAMIDPWEVQYDTDGTGIGAVVLGNGTAVMTIKGVELHADIAPTTRPVVAPCFFFQELQAPDKVFETKGAAIELLLYATELPGALDLLLTALHVKNDNVDLVVEQQPSSLAQAYVRSARPFDGLDPYDISRNCSPIRWSAGRINAEEREYPITLTKRTVNFQGSSATRNLRRHWVEGMKLKKGVIESVAAMYGLRLSGDDWMKTPVRYPGRDPIIDQLFGARIIPVKAA